MPHFHTSQRGVLSSATIRRLGGLNALRPTLANGLPFGILTRVYDSAGPTCRILVFFSMMAWRTCGMRFLGLSDNKRLACNALG